MAGSILISRPTPYSGTAWAGRRVGLLGGSFNPAHDGHVHISLLALKKLGLDQVWWLVSPQNPLKPARGMAPFAERKASAKRIAADRRILVSDLEAQLGTRYTIDTLEALKHRFPRTDFVWLMGADNLAGFHRWRRWQDIFATVPIAVFDRPTYSPGALASRAARHFARFRRTNPVGFQPPAWALYHTQLNELSSTEIRNQEGKDR